MSEKLISFGDVCAINVNDKAEKKNGLTYLSWAWAWAEFVKVYPNASYEIVKNVNGMPYFKDECGAFVYTKVDNGNLIHEMWLPVMDNRNQAIKSPDAMAINKTVMRCLTKNLAMFGLGLYIYAGEDLPETEEPVKQEVKQEVKKVENPALVLFNKLKSHYSCTDDEVKAMLSFLNITSKDADKIQNALNDFGSIIVFLDDRGN